MSPVGVGNTASSGPSGGNRGFLGSQRFTMDFKVQGEPNSRQLLKYTRRMENVGGIDFNQSSAWAGSYKIDFPAENHTDEDVFYSAADMGSNTTRVQVKKAGHYRVDLQVMADLSSGVSANPTFRLQVNATGGAQGQLWGALNTNINDPRGAMETHGILRDLAADDFIEVQCAQDSSGATGVLSSVSNRTIINVTLLAQTDDDPIGGRQVAPYDGVIEKVVLIKGLGGTTGSTEVDIKRNGSSIVGSTPLALGWSDTFLIFGQDYLTDTEIQADDEYTISVPADEDPFLRDLTVQVWCHKKL